MLGSGRDPEIFVWSFAWWPHAISARGRTRSSRTRSTRPTASTSPGRRRSRARARVRAAHRLLAGPVVSYNVAALLMPALAAWTAFLLCRYLTRLALAVARRRLPVRLLELHARPGARAPAHDRGLPRPARRARRPPLPRRELAARGLALAARRSCSGSQLWFSTELLVHARARARRSRSRSRSALVPAAPAAPAAAAAPARRRLRARARCVAAPLVVYALTGFHSESINTPARVRRRPPRTSSSRRSSSRSRPLGWPSDLARTSPATTPSRAPTSACRRC